MAYRSHQEYRDAWKQAPRVDPAVPLNVDIELASLCNLRCPFCFYGEAAWHETMSQLAADGKPKKRLMPTELAIRIINEAAALGVPALKFNWRGESTLHPDYSFILEHAANKTRWISNPPSGPENAGVGPAFFDLLVNTNANCKDSALDGLMAATKCMISLDSTVPEIYAQMRVNGRLERAIEVARELIRSGHPNLWIRRVITKLNQAEPFKQRVDELLGGNGYRVSEHHCMDRGDAFHAANNPAQYERTYCGYPSQRIMVAADGTCYPCCVDTDGTMPVGNVNDQSLAEIWNGLPMVQLRGELRAGVFKSEICKRCESWKSYVAPQRDMVEDKAL